MNNPKVSVLMSVYNCGKYIEKSIDSILLQSFWDFEFIIFDDGSTDNTLDLIEKAASNDNRIIVVKNPVNLGFKGFVQNLNLGLKNSKGIYIARMDGDDLAHSERLQEQFNFLNENQSIDLVASSFNYIDEQGMNIGSKVYDLNDKQVKELFPNVNPIHQPTVMFKNDQSLFYRDKALYCEDRDLWLRMATSNKCFAVIPKILLDYRVTSSSISHKNKSIQDAYVSQVNSWYNERLLHGTDSYENFIDINNISLRSKPEGEGLVASIKIKFLFRSSVEGSLIRKEIIHFLRTYGFFYWLPIYVYFISTFNNFFSKQLKRYILNKILV